jgi:Cdc6-like AAA superfamily ATPase
MEQLKEPYCQALRAEGVLSLDRVESPWTAVPDVPRYNRRAFRFIQHDLAILKKACENGQRPDSRGILVLGEAGTGKTHLLMRVANSLSQENPLLFIGRPTNEEAVGPHIWEKILESLSQKFGGDSSYSQLDVLLSRVFARIVIEALEAELAENGESEQKQRWIESLRSDPLQLRGLLGQGEGRAATFNMFRRKILNHLGAFRPHADQTITRVLVTHCLVGADNKKRILRLWLAGHEIDDAEAKELGLTRAAVLDDGTISQASLHQARERFSLKCIQTLGELSTYHAPLILAFDQLEGLRHQSQTLTHRFGDTVRELFTMAPNFLVVTCAFPSCWTEWFERELDTSAAQRIGQNRVELEAFGPEHGEQLLSKHLDPWFSKFSLPTSLYPFTPADVQELCARARSVREFLQAARRRFLDWLDEERSENERLESADNAPEVITSREIHDAIYKQWRKCSCEHFNTFPARPSSEQELFGKLHELICAILPGHDADPPTVQSGKRVLPAHVRIQCHGAASGNQQRSIVLVVCNANGVAFTARVKNLLAALREERPTPTIFLVRDDRSSPKTPSMQKMIDEVSLGGGKFEALNRDTFSDLMALHDCLIAAEEGDLTAGTTTINRDKLLPHLRAIAATPKVALLQLFAPEAGTLLPSAPCFVQSEEIEFTTAQVPAAIAPLMIDDPACTVLPACGKTSSSPALLSETVSASALLGFEKQIGRDVVWDVSIRTNPHLMVVGLPGMGKTTCLINICTQLASQGIAPIVFSYHEDIDAALEERLGGINRINHSSLGFNPLRLDSSQARAHIDSAGRMRDIFASIFPDLGDLQTNLIRQAIKQSYEKVLNRGVAAVSPRFRDFFQILQQQPKPDKGLMARLTELDDYGLFAGSSENDNLLATTVPSVASLHHTQNEVVQRAFASLLFYRIYQEMFRRGLQQRITHAIVFDEAHRASRLKLLGSMGKEGRKYGVSLILASQEARDFSPSMYSAVANYLVLRVTDQDAKVLAKNVAPSNSARQITDELKQLPKHEAIFFQVENQPRRTRLAADVQMSVKKERAAGAK